MMFCMCKGQSGMVFSCFVYLFLGNIMQSTNRSIWHCAATWSWPCTCRTYGTRVLLSHQLQGRDSNTSWMERNPWYKQRY